MIRAMPDRPAPPMPTKCTRPSWSAGSSSSGTGTLIGGASAAGGERPSGRASRRRRAGSARRRRADIVASRVGSVARAGTVAATHSGVSAPSCDEQRAPGVDDRAGVEACSPLPIGSGTNTAGRPTAATSVTVLAPQRHTTRSAAA